MGTDGCAHDPVDAIGRRRFDQNLTAARLKQREPVIGNRSDRRRLISQPIFERLGIGHGRFAIAEQGADLGTMPFGGPPSQVQRVVRRGLNVELLGDLLTPSADQSRNCSAGNRPRSRKNSKQHGEV